jgi:hypothetical protein
MVCAWMPLLQLVIGSKNAAYDARPKDTQPP